MLLKASFKKSALSSSVHSILAWKPAQKTLCCSLFLSALSPAFMLHAAETPSLAITDLAVPAAQQQAKELLKNVTAELDAVDQTKTLPIDEATFDSYAMLQQQQNTAQMQFEEIELQDLEDIETPDMNAEMVNEIFRVAEDAKKQAKVQSERKDQPVVVNDATVMELAEINLAPIQVNELMQRIEQESNIDVTVPATVAEVSDREWFAQISQVETAEIGFIRRLWNRIRPSQSEEMKIPRISADVSIVNTTHNSQISDQDYNEALNNLKANIQAKLSTFTQESFADYNAAVPQLRNLSRQAAQAVGFYQAEFEFSPVNARQVKVYVKPNDVVLVNSQNIEFSGAGKLHPRFQVLTVLPELEEGDVFHHGAYSTTKNKIDTAASDNGFFDGYWRLHDVKIAQPENTADINLKYETGERYRLAEPEFRMFDQTKPFPLRPEILKQLVPWKEGDDYTTWRVNALANNLTNSRYFNYTTVEAIRPDPIIKDTEIPPDIQALLDEYQLKYEDINPTPTLETPKKVENIQRKQSVVNENQFAGIDQESEVDLEEAQREQDLRRIEQEKLKLQAREKKEIPVIVQLNADKLNSAELGAGYGTDSGPRIRGQYRRAIVNDRGHSFDANIELSQIRQAIDGRYNIPYKHPLNDYIAIVGGYEREERDNVSRDSDMLIESAVFGADRIIKNPRGGWQHNFGLRYRLDRLTLTGDIDPVDYPAIFSGGNSAEQQSLLLGYEISRSDTDKRVNPTQGFKQTYKVEVGSDSVLTDTNLAILNAQWRALYSLGDTAKHQFVGRADLGYIFSDAFADVPYNLRYFSGGDQSIRGFDYKSLSPEVNGFKTGGQALGIGSVEYNYEFKQGWRGAVFSDFGNAYNENFSNGTAYGVGLGLRWASPIGPVRIDVASGISDPGKPIRVHFFIGSQL